MTTAERAREIEAELKAMLPKINTLAMALRGPNEHGDDDEKQTCRDLRSCVNHAILCADSLADSREYEMEETQKNSPRVAAGN